MAHNNIAKYPVLEKVSSLEELRVAMIKIVSLNLCEKAWKGLCKNGFYVAKSHNQGNECKECKRISKREKYKKDRAARRLNLRSKNIKKKKGK